MTDQIAIDDDVPASPGPSAPSKRKRAVRQAPWLLVVPAVAAVLLLKVLPTLIGALYAFTNWDGLTLTAKWIGLTNFKNAFNDPVALGALEHTLELATAFVILINGFGLALALALRRTLRTRNWLRALFFIPVVLSPLGVSYIWSYIFSYTGPLNWFLRTIGLSSWQQVWLASPRWSLWVILVVLVWQFTGLPMVIYLAALAGIPEELDEAASVDGASTWMKFRRVTFPLLAPAFTTAVTLSWIFGLRVFDQVIALTNGGPANSTMTLATEVYNTTFVYGQYGYGAAIALIMIVLITVVAFTQTRILRAREARL